MINLGTGKIKDIYMGIDGISKVYLGTNLIWEKVKFEGLSVVGFGEVTFNDGGDYELPLNTSLKFTDNTNTLNYLDLISGGKTYRIFKDSTTFEIRNKIPFKLSREGIWDIKIIQSNEQPKVII